MVAVVVVVVIIMMVVTTSYDDNNDSINGSNDRCGIGGNAKNVFFKIKNQIHNLFSWF